MKSKNITTIRTLMYVVAFVVASLPLACGYVMSGGDILLWLARIEEVQKGLRGTTLFFFPSADVTVAYEGGAAALNSNLWLLIPALIRLLGGSITLAYRIFMLLINALALFCAKKMFDLLFENKNVAFFGVLLYLTCPYRIYICYDKADLGMAAACAFVPLFIWGSLKISSEKIQGKSVLITALAFAGIGYASSILWVMIAGLALLMVLYKRKLRILLPMLLGGILYLPGVLYLVKYLLKDGMQIWNIPLGTISKNGYQIGQFFTIWTYLEDAPGLGLGLLGALFVLAWLWFVEGNLQITKKYGFFVWTFLLFSAMSMTCFPWDMVQRIAALLLRLISLMETPGICFGVASLAACVLGAYGVEGATKHEKLFVRVGIPMMVLVAAIGAAIYLCNTMTYYRMPMFLMDSL